MKIAVTIRACFQYDGRLLAQLVTLANKFKSSKFRVYVYPNCKTESIELPLNVEVMDFNPWSEKLPDSSVVLLIKQIHFAIYMLFSLIKYKPHIIHAHDEFAILGPLLYKKLINKKVNLVYDDHELYNLDPNLSVYRKLRRFLEFKMFGSANKVIMANNHRAEYAKTKVPYLKNKEITVIDNYPFSFFQSRNVEVETFKRINGLKYLLHQGEINKYRGIDLLIKVLNNLPDEWRLVLLGLSLDKYENFIKLIPQHKEKIVNGGRVHNDQIIAVYKNFDASVIFYKTEKINEKFCAPNRLYQAANAGLPLLVNNNPVLFDFVDKYDIGLAIDSVQEKTDKKISYFFNNYNKYKENSEILKNEFLYEQKVAPVLLNLYSQFS